MISRAQLDSDEDSGNYFAAPKESYEFISSGCTILNCVLGGGWPLGRWVNVVGTESTGKTLLAIEAAANFINTYPDGKVWYRETEKAFDVEYAKALGLPINKIDFGEYDLPTIEDVAEDLEDQVDWAIKKDARGLYIIDSLDACSDRAEMKRVQKRGDDGTYGMDKQKVANRMFRTLNTKVSAGRVCVFVINQVRTKIGVTFGEKSTRTGAGALNYFASQIIYLNNMDKIKHEIGKIKRVVGVHIQAKCRKNKIGVAQRDCVFPIEFGFGIDDVAASVAWLKEVDRLSDAGIKNVAGYLRDTASMSSEDYRARSKELAEIVKQAWGEIELDFMPKRRKY